MEIPIDNIPKYEIFFKGTKEDFKQYEYLIRIRLLASGGKFSVWANPLIKDDIYLCETPEPSRLIQIPELFSIIKEIIAFANNELSLDELKQIATISIMPDNYKVLINSMSVENRKDYIIDTNFNDFLWL